MNLDHLYGRIVQGIGFYDADDDEPAWQIVLDGNVIIRNLDQRRTTQPKPEIVGSAFLSHNDSETNVQLNFGHTQENGPPIYTGVVDLTVSKFEIAVPGAVSLEDNLAKLPPSDPERTQEGPSQEYLDAQEAAVAPSEATE